MKPDALTARVEALEAELKALKASEPKGNPPANIPLVSPSGMIDARWLQWLTSK